MILLCKLISIQGYAIIDRIIFYFYVKIHLFERRSFFTILFNFSIKRILRQWSFEFMGNIVCVKYRYRSVRKMELKSGSRPSYRCWWRWRLRPWASFLRGKGIFVRRIRFVGPRVKISLYVRKCLRPGDILGGENVSTVRWGQRCRSVKKETTSDKKVVMRVKCEISDMIINNRQRNSQSFSVCTPLDGCDVKWK